MTNTAADPHFWNGLAARYAAQPVEDPTAFDRKTAITREHLQPGHTVLDIGCGTGSFAMRLAPSGAQIHGLDLSDEMVRIARDKVADAGLSNIRFHTGAFDDSFDAFDSGSLDAVYAYSLLHLIPERTAALGRIFALLRPGGTFIASTVCLGETWIPYTPILALMRLLGKAPWVAAGLSKDQLHEEVRAAGFSDVDVPDVGAKPIVDFLVAKKPG